MFNHWWQNLIFMEEQIVVFRHECETFELHKADIGLKKYYNEYNGKKEVDFQTKESHCHVRMFFDFLKNGKIPLEINDQIHVYDLLKEWDCCFSLESCYKFCIHSHPRKGIIIINNQQYPVNVGVLSIYCSAFQEFHFYNPSAVCCIEKNEWERGHIECFIDLLHNNMTQPKPEYEETILEMCQYFGCNSLYLCSRENALFYIISKQDDVNCDLSLHKCELSKSIENISKGSQSLLEMEKFIENLCRVHLPILRNIFHEIKFQEPNSFLLEFLKKYSKLFGLQALILMSVVRFNGENIDKFNSICTNIIIETLTPINSSMLIGVDYESTLKKKVAESEKNNEEAIQVYNGFMKRIEILEMEKNKKKEENLKNEMEIFKNDFLEEKKKQEELLNIEEGKKKEWEELEKSDRNQKPPNFEKNIFEAAKNGNFESLVFLLADGADINSTDSERLTPLIYAVYNCRINVVMYLINKKAEIDKGEILIIINGFQKLHSFMQHTKIILNM